MEILCAGSGQPPQPQEAELGSEGVCPRCALTWRLDREYLIVKHTVHLTVGQARILLVLREGSPRTFNNRARPQLERLEQLGLVTVDWDMRASAKGSGIELVGHNVVTITKEGETHDD